MQLELLTALKTAISGVTGMKTVEYYNNQLEHSNMVKADGSPKGDEAQFAYPACFIKFGDATYKDLLSGDQLIENQEIELYIATKSLAKDDVSTFLALVQSVNYVVHGLSTANWNRLSRVSSSFDSDWNNISVNIVRYLVSGRDRSARRPKNTQQVEDVSLALTSEIKISDPPTDIRTDVPL